MAQVRSNDKRKTSRHLASDGPERVPWDSGPNALRHRLARVRHGAAQLGTTGGPLWFGRSQALFVLPFVSRAAAERWAAEAASLLEEEGTGPISVRAEPAPSGRSGFAVTLQVLTFDPERAREDADALAALVGGLT